MEGGALRLQRDSHLTRLFPMKNPVLLLFSPDPTLSPSPAPTPSPTKAPLVRGAFNREVAAEISEAQEIAVVSREAPYAAILKDDYDVPPATLDQIESLAHQAATKFGLAAGGAQSGIADTAAKQKLEDTLDAAIRRLQTGARLSFPDSLPDQKRFGIGIDLGNAEDQVELLVPQILEQLKTETLRSVKPEHIAAMKDAFEAWEAAGGAQGQTKLSAQNERAAGTALLEQMRPLVREIKICIDGEFPYDGKSDTGQSNALIRKQFHLSETRPFVSNPRP